MDENGVQNVNKVACIIRQGEKDFSSYFVFINNNLFIHSIIDFLIKEYKADPYTFVYEWHYDPFENKTLIAIAYIDLGNYLSSKKEISN